MGLRFTDDENRILELHVTDWCDVDITERALDDMGRTRTVRQACG